MSIGNRDKDILLLISSILFSLFILEVILRLFFLQETKRLAIYDKELGWRGKPYGKGVYVRKKDNIFVDFKYNSNGFRGEDFSSRRSDSTRIVITGDSFVEGLEVDYDATFIRLLEGRLNRELDSRFEVINLSSQGYSTAQELLALKRYWDIIEPQIVLLGFYTGNDFNDNMRKKFTYLDEEGHLRFNKNEDSWLKAEFLAFKRWIYENCHLVFFLKNIIESYTQIRLADNARTVDRSIRKVSDGYRYKLRELLISEMTNQVESNNAIFGIVVLPSRTEVVERAEKNPKWLSEHCQNKEILCLNLYHVLTKNDFFDYDGHLNRNGHKTVANEIAEFFYAYLNRKEHLR